MAHLLFVTIGSLHHADNMPEKAVRDVTAAGALSTYEINAVTPLRVVHACLPLLSHRERSAVVVLSAKVGSITDNRLGGWYSYRMSKAALNMGLKSLALEIAHKRRAPIVMAVHPGTTRTSLSSRYLRATTPHSDAGTTADRLIDLAVSAKRCQHGRFLNWDGTALPW